MARGRRVALLLSLAACTSTSATVVGDGGTDAAAATDCDEIQARAAADVEDAEARAAADALCAVDDDCTYEYGLGSCAATRPCALTALSKAGAAAVEDAKRQVSATICKPFYEAGCFQSPPPPCPPPPYGPYCNAGRCSEQKPVDAGDEGG